MNRQDAKAAKKEPSDDLDRLAASVVDAALEVHRTLGPGYAESIYEEAVCHELRLRSLGFVRQAAVAVTYNGHAVGEGRVDLLFDEGLVVESKAVESMLPVHRAQMISYLKATGSTLGLLINFNVKSLRDGIQRVIRATE